MRDNKRIEKERKYWDKLSPKYDKFIQKHWKIYESTLLDKILDDNDNFYYNWTITCLP